MNLRLTSFQKLALTTIVAVYVMIVIGVIVRSTGSGLGCGDWPLCRGVIIPTLDGANAWDQADWIESIHRWWGVIIGFLGIGLGSPGQPHILVRYMSIDDPRKLTQSAVIGTFWNVVMAWGAVCIGLLGRAAVPAPEDLPDGNTEMVYLVLCSKYFGPALYGLLVGGIFVMETVSVMIQVVSFKLTGRRIFLMTPIHHHFEQLGWAEQKIVIRFWIVAIILSLVALSSLKLR